MSPFEFSQYGVDLAAIQLAHERIRPYVRHTPTLTCPALDERFNAKIFLKCENLQAVGAFKARGASNAIFSLTDAEAERGVVTHSSGNHAAAVARAASLCGITAHIVMPENSSPKKIANVKKYGVEPVFCEPTAESRQNTAQAIIDKTGGTLIHPYDDLLTIAGQGTAALELMEQAPDLDLIIVPVGGGGLLAGTLIAAKSVNPMIRVYAAEPDWANDAYRSLQSGERQMPTRVDTIADGLRTPIGEKNWPIIRDLVDGILLASEEGIASATRIIIDEAKLVVEPSAATPLAAMMEYDQDGHLQFPGMRIGIILSGGNLDLDALPWCED
jgi:threonine dehydratase